MDIPLDGLIGKVRTDFCDKTMASFIWNTEVIWYILRNICFVSSNIIIQTWDALLEKHPGITSGTLKVKTKSGPTSVICKDKQIIIVSKCTLSGQDNLRNFIFWLHIDKGDDCKYSGTNPYTVHLLILIARTTHKPKYHH
jgi:hypothetical protein